MKALQMARHGDPWQELEIREIDTPSPGDDGVLIRVEATDLSFADILQCQGSYQVRLTPPFTPGMNAAGTVIESGSRTDLRPGTRIIGPTLGEHGGYAEEAVLDAHQVFLIPAGIEPIQASGMHITYGTAWFGLLHRARLEAGETVLVLAAAGGVGSAAVHMARALGCYVIAAAGGPEKCRIARELGADEVIDYNNDDLYDAVMQLTDGRGVDLVYDPVGGPWFDIARRLVAWEGRLVVIGFASGEIPSAPMNHALVKNYSIVGVHMGGYQTRDQAVLQRCYAELHQQMLDGTLTPMISEVTGFDELPSALKRMAERRTVGRIVFDPTA